MKSLKMATMFERDNEVRVKDSIECLGAEEFKYASKRLRSDAGFILELVKDYPEILQWAEEKIHERFVDRFGRNVDNENGKNLIFIMRCCGRNINSYKYLDEKSATAYYERVKSGFVKQGEYLGLICRCYVALDEVDEHLKELTEMRPEITEKIENAVSI